MVNGLHLYSAFTDGPNGHRFHPMATKALYILPHIHHSYSHSYTDGGVSHSRRHPARREQLGLGVLLMDTSTLGQVEPGIEPPTFRFVDKLHKPDPLTVFRFPKHPRAVRLTGTLMMQSPEDEEP